MENSVILSEIFNKKWNYAWGDPTPRVVSLFYIKGGIKGIIEHLNSEKQRMDKKDSNMGGFETYYSIELFDLLEKLIDLSEEDFAHYAIHFSRFKNINNFKKLREYGLLKHIGDFDSDFRGDITQLIPYNDIKIVETRAYRSGEGVVKYYYNLNEPTRAYSNPDVAYFNLIFNKEHVPSVTALYELIKM
jgi:hypothetical protein